MQLPLEDKLYSSAEVSKILGVSLRTLYRYMDAGSLDSIQTPTGRHRYTKKQIEDFLNRGFTKREVTNSAEHISRHSVSPRVEIEAVETAKTKPVYEEVLDDDEVSGKEYITEEKEVDVPENPTPNYVEDYTQDASNAPSNADPSAEDSSLSLSYEQEEVKDEPKEFYFRSSIQDVRSLARTVKETADKNSITYAFSGLGGMSLHYPIRPFNNLFIYANILDFDVWKTALSLEESTKAGSNFKIKTDPQVLDNVKSLGGLMVVADETLLADLEADGHIDMAEEFKSKKGL